MPRQNRLWVATNEHGSILGHPDAFVGPPAKGRKPGWAAAQNRARQCPPLLDHIGALLLDVFPQSKDIQTFLNRKNSADVRGHARDQTGKDGPFR